MYEKKILGPEGFQNHYTDVVVITTHTHTKKNILKFKDLGTVFFYTSQNFKGLYGVWLKNIEIRFRVILHGNLIFC